MDFTATALTSPAEAFEPLFAQRALLAVLALAALAGALGPAIVLRELPFYAHAVGGGAYPVLVLGVLAGVPLALAAPLGALAFSAVLFLATAPGKRGEHGGQNRDPEIALALAAAFALGALLATTAFDRPGAVALSPESLLFGSVLTAGDTSIAVAWVSAIMAGAVSLALGMRWLAIGFDPTGPRPKRWRAHEAALLAVVALAVAAALPLAGALMGAALLVVPAATARVTTDHRPLLAPITLAIATAQGLAGLYLALVLDLPPGALIAALSGATFAVVALVRAAARRPAHARAALASAGAALALALAGCAGGGSGAGGDAGKTAAEAPRVVVTTTQLGDIARQVAGERAEVTTLMKPGSDPHAYEPKPSDVQALADADVILYSGGELDEWLADALDASGNSKQPVEVSQSVQLIDSTAANADPDAAGFNAHWYLSPTNLAAAADRARIELAKARFTARDTFRHNADNYRTQTESTAARLKACARTVPRDRRAVVAEHDDFDYLTGFLGIEVAARLRESGAGEASARDADEALSNARAANAGAVLVSVGEGGALPAATAKRLGVPLLRLHGDSLATSGEAATALGAIAADTRAIVEALGGDPTRCQSPSR